MGISLGQINSEESIIDAESKRNLADDIDYFTHIQEALLIGLDNKGKPIPIPNTPNNAGAFTFITTTRVFSISKNAMDQTLRGYAFSGMALTRILAELVQCNGYLVRHNNDIDRFISGKLKVDKVLKLAKHEHGSCEHDSFGIYWGFLSNYSHASPTLLAFGCDSTPGKLTTNLLATNQPQIKDVAYGIVGCLLNQYLLFRSVFIDKSACASELIERDKYIFLPANIRKYLGFRSISEADLDAFYAAWVGEDAKPQDREHA
jgi:hypothetical protein